MFPIKLIKCPNHAKIKERILDLIDTDENQYQIDHEDDPGPNDGPLTDWTDDYREERPEYLEIFLRQAAEDILDVVRYDFGFHLAEIGHFWYQQYEQKFKHGWHFHGHCLYHAVYYTELPKGTPPTLCRLPGGFEFYPNAEEGDILIMPSIVEHTSPPNQSEHRKTIIAVNIDEPYPDPTEMVMD